MADIINKIITRFTSQGANNVEGELNRLGRSQTRLGQSSASSGRAFAAQASGLGGLVAAYAGAAATIFAVTAAFDALSRAAQTTQTLAGLKNLATAAGESSDALLGSIIEITKGQLTISEAAQQINLSLSAGFDNEQIEGLADVALRASRALGRDLTDAYTRVVRGSAKLETELLDELGIYTKIDPAIRAYAIATGKVASELTEFERRQAFVNAVIAEGERKFNSINVTVPTSAEKIAAFGTRVEDLLLLFGRFLADGLAPVAEFLTESFAGSFAAVGAILILVAKTAVAQLTIALTALQAKLLAVAQTSSAFVVKSLGDFRGKGAAAQTAIKGVALAMNGLTRANQAELKSLRDVAQTRRLTNDELRKAGTLLTDRENKLKTNINTLFAQRRAQQAVIRSTTATTAERTAATAALARLNARILTNVGLLRATRAQLAATTAGLRTFSAALSAATAGVIKLGAAIVTGLLATATRFIGLAGGIIGFVAIVGLIGSAIAGVIGKQEEYNALLQRGALSLKTFFAPSTFNSFKNEFTNLASSAVENINTVQAGLGDIEKFTIKTKSFGIDVNLVKTKEDLVKEVGSVLNEVVTSATVTFGDALTGEAGRRGAAIGAIFGGIVGSFFAPIAGTAAGAAIGAGLGAAVAAAFGSGSEVEAISIENATRLGELIGDSTIAGISQQAGNENLAKALNLLYQQGAAAAELSLEGRRYLRTQVELTEAIVDNIDNIRALQVAADTLGLSVAELEKKFQVSANAIGDTIIQTINKGFDTVQVEIVLQNEQSTIEAIERIRELASGPGRLTNVQGTDLSEARSRVDQLQNEIKSIDQTLINFAEDTSETTAQVITDLNNLQMGFQNFVPNLSDTTPLDTLQAILTRLQATYEANTRVNMFGFTVAQDGREAETAAIKSAIGNVEDLIRVRTREADISANLTEQQQKLNNLLAEQQAIITSLESILNREVVSDDQVSLVEAFLTALSNLGITTTALSRDILIANNLLTDLVTTADSGALTLENLAQAESNVDRSLSRSSRGLQDAITQLEALRAARDAVASSNIDPTGAILRDINEQVARQEDLVAAEAASLGTTTERNEIILAGIAPLREQLQIAKDLKDNFEQEIKARQSAIGLFTDTGRITLNEQEQALRRTEFLNEVIQDGNAALTTRNNLEEQYNTYFPGRPALVAQISSLIGEGAKEARRVALETAGIDAAIITVIDNLTTLNAEQALLADNAETATDALQGTVIEFIRNLFDATVKSKQAIAELQFEIAQLSKESEIARIEFQVALDNQAFTALKTQIENEIETIENEITLINLLTDLGDFTPISKLADQVRTELGPALEESARRFTEITGRAATSFSIEIPENLQGLTEREAAATETQKQLSILEKRLQLNDLELERETNRIERERDILQLEFDLFYAEQQFETQKQQALADLNKAQLQGLAAIYSQALGAQATVQQQHVDALAQVFIQAANQIAAANSMQGFSATIAAPNISGANANDQIATNLQAAITAYEQSVTEQAALTQELADARTQAEVEAFVNRQTLLDGEQTAAETAHQQNIRRIIEEGNITAATGANALRDLASGKASEKAQADKTKDMIVDLFKSIQSSIETAITGVSNFILYGEGNLSDIFGTLFKSVQQDFFKTTIAKPLSNALTSSLFGALGVDVTTGIENAQVRNGALLVQIVNGPSDFFEDAINGSGEGGLFSNLFSGVSEFFSGLFGRNGAVANLFTGIFGSGGLFSSIFTGFGSIFGNLFSGVGSVFGTILGGIFGMAQGGMVHMASGGQLRDRVPALLEPGEFVIRKPMAREIGTPALQALNATGQMPTSAPIINFKNEGTAKSVQAEQPRFDGEKYVIDIITRDLANNGPIRRTLRSGNL